MDLTGSKWLKNTGKNAVFRRFVEVRGSLWMMKWWPGRELNPRHADFQSAALPTELPGHAVGRRVLNRRERRSSMNNHEISHLRGATAATRLFGHVFLGLFRTLAKEE